MKIFAIIFSLVMLLTSCGTASDTEGFQTPPDFVAELVGNRGELAFSCTTVCKNGVIERVEYTAPDALAGVTVIATEQGIRIKRGESEQSFSADAAEGLLLPARLLLPTNVRLLSKQTAGREQVLSLQSPQLAEAMSVTLGEDGLPSAVCSPSISFTVRFFPAES